MTASVVPGGVFRGPPLVPTRAAPWRRRSPGRRLVDRLRGRPTHPPAHAAKHPLAPPGPASPVAPGRRRSRTAPPPPRTAFVFAGGGARGAAQIGMLQALVARGIVPDVVLGASVGAVNAAAFAGRPDPAGVATMADHWRRITSDDIFVQGRIPTPWRFLQQRGSVHPNDGLRRVIENGTDYRRIEDARIPLRVVATSLTDGRVRWFDRGPLVESVLASSALPALFPPVQIDGESFIDGGVVDNVPVSRAFAEGAQRVFVLLCGPLHYRPYPAKRPVEAVLTAFFVAIHARFARELADLPPATEVIVFSVGGEPVSRYDDFSTTEALIAAGRANAEAVLTFWEAGGTGELAEVRDIEQELLAAAQPAPAPAATSVTSAASATSATSDGARTGVRATAVPSGPRPPTGGATGAAGAAGTGTDAAGDHDDDDHRRGADGPDATAPGLPRAVAGAYRRPVAASRAAWNTVRTASERSRSRTPGASGATGATGTTGVAPPDGPDRGADADADAVTETDTDIDIDTDTDTDAPAARVTRRRRTPDPTAGATLEARALPARPRPRKSSPPTP